MNRENDPTKAISDARAERLNSWVNTHYRNQREFVEKFGLNQGEISNILKKRRVLGERRARKLEQQTGMPEMFLDGSNQDVRGSFFSNVALSQKVKEVSEEHKYQEFINTVIRVGALYNENIISEQDKGVVDFVIVNTESALKELMQKYVNSSNKKSAS